MTNEAYTMVETIKERKSMLSGARHKKGGSKSKKCTLPSDTLTKREKEKMNGEMKVYNLKYPVTYSEFMDMPQDIKEEYIRSMQLRYHANASMLANAFRMTVNEFGEMMNGLGIVVNEITPDNNRLKVWNAAQPVRRDTTVISKPPKEPKYKTRRELQKMSGNDLVDYLVQCCQYFNCTINTLTKAAWELRSFDIYAWSTFKSASNIDNLDPYRKPAKYKKSSPAHMSVRNWAGAHEVKKEKAAKEHTKAAPPKAPSEVPNPITISGSISVKLTGDLDQVKTEINKLLDMYYNTGLEINFQISK